MRKLLLLIIVIICFSQYAMAQNCTIFGNLKDSVSGTGVAYAHIVILNEVGHSINMGGISDEKGNYKIDKLPYGNYNMKISGLGYKTKIIKDIKLSPEQKKIKIDAFIEIDIIAIDEVAVIANRSSIELKPDKKIVHIDPTAAVGGESVAEFLKSLPEIKVDGNNVTLKTYAPTILVNGKPAGPTMQDITQIPASLISSVEVITNPSVRYNPEGLGGIINLKTRKLPEGINGMVQGSAKTNNTYNGAGTLNYKTKKWNLFANIYDRYYGNKETGSLKQQFDSGDAIYQTNSVINRVNRVCTRIGADFEPDSMNVLTLYWEYQKRSGTMKQNNYWEETGLSLDRIFEIEQIVKLDSREHQIGFNYIHTFKNDGELDINISQNFGYEPSKYDMSYKDTNTSTFYSENLYDGKESDLEINYSSTIFKTWDLETGTSLYWEHTEVSDSLSGNSINGYHHLFGMDRVINAYYLSLGKNLGKFDITAGIRGEYVYQKLNSAVHQSPKNKFDFFPHIGLSYNINDEISLNVNYGRRIERPHIFALTPYATIDYNFPSQRYIGNPDLIPAYTNSVDLGAYFSWSKFSTSVSTSYMHTRNEFAYVYYLQDTLTYAILKNISTSQKILFNINFDYHAKLFKVYRPILTVRFGQDFYDSPDANGKNIHKSFFNYHLNLNNIFYLPKGFFIFLDVTYFPRTYMYASTTEDRININLVVRKTFWKVFTVQVAFYDMLNSKRIENIYGDGFTSKNILNENNRAVVLGLMYKFGKPINTRSNVNLNLNKIETQ